MNAEHRLLKDLMVYLHTFYDKAVFEMADSLKQVGELTLLLHRGYPASGRIVIVLQRMITGKCCVNTTLPIGQRRVGFESASCVVMPNT